MLARVRRAIIKSWRKDNLDQTRRCDDGDKLQPIRCGALAQCVPMYLRTLAEGNKGLSAGVYVSVSFCLAAGLRQKPLMYQWLAKGNRPTADHCWRHKLHPSPSSSPPSCLVSCLAVMDNDKSKTRKKPEVAECRVAVWKANTAGLQDRQYVLFFFTAHTHLYMYMHADQRPHERSISWFAHALRLISAPSCLFAEKIASKSWMARLHYRQGGAP